MPRVTWLSVPEAAEALGISERTLWRKIAAGEVATRKRGGRTLVKVEHDTDNPATSATDASTDSDTMPDTGGPPSVSEHRKRQTGFDPARHVEQEVRAEEARFRLRQIKAAHEDLDRQEGQRAERERQKAEAEERRRREEALARERARLEAEEKRKREEAEAARHRRRREIIQGVKDRVIKGWWSLRYTIPPETQAQALKEIERELSALAVEELSESELVGIAEGIRDKHYKPVMQAQDLTREEEAARQQQALGEALERLERSRQKQALVERGVQYASDELADLPFSEEWRIEQRVREDLEGKLTGEESWAQVRDLVDEMLDEELGE